MIRRIAVASCVVFICMTAVVAAQECEVLRVGGTDGWLPVAYIDQETKEAVGIAHDLARVLGEKLNIPVDIKATLPWKRVLEYVKDGDLDMIAAIYWTQERDDVYQYTAPYFSNETRVFVLKGKEFTFETFEDLIGLRGGIPSGGSFGEAFDTFAKEHELRLEGVKTKEQMTLKVMAGRNDYFLQDYLDGMMYLKQEGLLDEIVALPRPVSTTDVYFAFSRQSPCAALVPRINEIIEEAKQDGTLQGIIDSYIQ